MDNKWVLNDIINNIINQRLLGGVDFKHNLEKLSISFEYLLTDQNAKLLQSSNTLEQRTTN